MEQSAHRMRRPLQPRVKTEQPGPTGEGIEAPAHEGKYHAVDQSHSNGGAVQRSISKKEKKEKTASLVISLSFLAPPVGRSAEELSVEEVCCYAERRLEYSGCSRYMAAC